MVADLKCKITRPLHAALVCALLFAASCSKTSTSVSAPSGAKCSVAVTNAPAAPFPANGGNGSIGVSTTRDCTWTVSADSNWVTLATASGQGEGTVSFSVSANTIPTPRSSALVISTERVPLSQAAAPCHFELSRTTDTIDASGGRMAVNVSTLNGCTWTATSTASWIGIQSGKTGNASGTVALDVSANPGADRVGQVTIAGQTYTVVQSSAPPGIPAPVPTPTPSPSRVQVTGKAQSISGRCPAIRFDLGGTSIATNSDTDFRNLKCTDVKKGVRLAVQGIAQPNGGVLATDVTKTSND
jgi:Viral BACON domain/Domain of unknown function (DUF5666)/Putative binding domain, N-terminal